MEYIDIVDENDNIIGVNTRKDSYKNKTTNRVVSIIIFNEEGKLLLQKRAKTCSFLPGYWALSAGGHVSSGQTYEESAKRELKEELGIETDLKFIGKFYEDRLKINGELNKQNGIHFFHEKVFEGTYDSYINYDREDNDEVDEVRFFTFNEIKEMIESKSDFIMPSAIFILKKYYF